MKTKILSILALLLAAVTQGAWAQEPATTYKVTVNDGNKDANNWTITSGQKTATGDAGLDGLSENDPVTLTYSGRLKVKSVTATTDAGAPAAPTGNTVDLSTLTANYEAQNGDVLTGSTSTYCVTIADGATVTLDGATISGSSYCIKCAGSATIILKDGTTNTLTSTSQDYPALWAGDATTTLTIQGNTGVLNVQSGEYCAGIGGGYSNTDGTCGDIRIEGGIITAQGGNSAAGIGSDSEGNCGDITISGGTVEATGGYYAAGIGGGNKSSCGTITITSGVTSVTATKGSYSPNSIGAGDEGICGTVTIEPGANVIQN